METTTAPVNTVTNVVPVAGTSVPVVVPPTAVKTRKSQKGEWGKVGAPPKVIKYPRGSFTINDLVTLNPSVCELTLRNTVTNNVRGFKVVNGKNVLVPVTFVKLPKNVSKETVGRPNFRFMSKAAFDANQNNLAAKKAVKNVVARTTNTSNEVVAGDVVS